MLAIAVSLLFGLAAFAALVVIACSLTSGARRVWAIVAELAEMERQARVTRPLAARLQPRPAMCPAFAAA